MDALQGNGRVQEERGDGMIDEDTLMRIAIIYALISIIGILLLVIVARG